MPIFLSKRGRRGVALASAVLGSLLAWLSGCVDKYTPDVISAPQSYLVVDGFINLNGVTTVRLTRTRNLSTGTASPAEAQASVVILDETGARYPLTEQAAGTYTSGSLVLPASHQYQLRLRTAAGREYASDLVAARLTPAIDKVSWAATADGIQLYLDAHDDANATRYYRWGYQETWEFQPPYISAIEYIGNQQVQTRKENIFLCWRAESSTSIVLSSTSNLSRDAVAKFPLLVLPANSLKLRLKYSILVQQYGLTADEFAYWEKLRKNTETLGTLFDPLPSQLAGNVHGLTDASELVLGYVGASSVTEKRLFIDNAELPRIRYLTGYEGRCELQTVKLEDMEQRFGAGGLLPIEALGVGRITGYSAATPECADCRLHGTNVKPSFWP